MLRYVFITIFCCSIWCGTLQAKTALLPEALVSTEWLAQRLDDPNIRLIEVSVIPEQFNHGHIPGAVNLNWHTDLVDTVQRDIVPRERLQILLRKAGVSENSTIVLYGDNHNWFAAWGAWVLDVYGVKQVYLLNGGRVKWEMEGRPLQRIAVQPSEGNITVGPAHTELRAFLPDVVAAAKGHASDQLIDIRSPAEYRGEIIAPVGMNELAMRAGHIPGAVNVPWGELVNRDGTFKPVDELKQLYASAGIDGSRPIITYCRIGERSSHSWFALSRLLGYQVRNYDGSWTEYGNSVAVPINNPAGTVWSGN